jgi:hypothetical protein
MGKNKIAVKIKDIVWTTIPIEYELYSFVCLAYSAITDRPVLGQVVDITISLETKKPIYLVSFEGGKALCSQGELLGAQTGTSKEGKIGFK